MGYRDDFHRPSYAKGYTKGKNDAVTDHMESIAKSLERIANHMESNKTAEGIHSAISDALFMFWRDRLS